jgi:outer membrane protein insertion porin family
LRRLLLPFLPPILVAALTAPPAPARAEIGLPAGQGAPDADRGSGAPPGSPAGAPVAVDAAPGSSRAVLADARGRVIASVSIAGNRRVPSEDLAAYLSHLRPGKTFTPEGMAADVHELWASGLIDDVEADLGTDAGGVRVRLLVREKPTLAAIEITGNDAVARDDLDEALSSVVKKGEVVGHDAVRRAVEKLRDKYAEEGYLLAEVHGEVVPRRHGEVVARFTVREGKKVSVQRINFVGNRSVSAEELEEVMMTGKGGPLSFLGIAGGGAFRQDWFERDILVLNALYYDRGHLAVQIGTPRVMVTPEGSGVEITIPITEGPRYRIRTLRVAERDQDGHEIEPLGGRRHLREMIHAKEGDFFNRALLVKDLAAVQTMYRDTGYANVEAPPATNFDPERAEVDLDVTIRRGKIVRFGRIEIKGNTKTRDKVIRREMEIAEEALFSETGVEHSRQRITALGYFERVDLSTQQGIDPGHLDVVVEVTEKPTGTFQVGAGFSSLESFLFTAQVKQDNLFGTGRSLSLNAQISGVRQMFDFRFFEPRLLDSPFFFSVNLFDQLRAYDQFTQASKGGMLMVGRRLFGPSLQASLAYSLQQDRVENPGGGASKGTAVATSVFPRLPLANLFSVGMTSSLRPSVTYDTRDNQLFPTQGMFLQGSVEYASRWLGSQNEFVRWRGTGRFYWPLTQDHGVVLRLNTEAGLVTSPNPSGVPVFARFFLGGIPDVRGFPLRSLGPRLPLPGSLDPAAAGVAGGANVGGNLMFYQNLEVEFPILKALNIRGVFFADLGNTWNLEGQYCRAAPASRLAPIDPCFSARSLLNARASAGFGIRWLSPMGPLRFEWGFPFHPLPYEKPMLFEFTIGSAF